MGDDVVDRRALASWSRRVIGGIVVAGLLATAGVVTYRVAVPPQTAPSTAPASSTSPPTSPRSGASDGAPSPAGPSATETGLPDGPGVTEPGIVILATPGSDESFTVLELIRLPEPVTEITLRPPPVTTDWGTDLADAQPRAVQVDVTAGDQALVVPDQTVSGEISLPLTVPADTVILRYRLEGTVVRTLPSAAGRALGAVASLADAPDDLPVVVIVSGDNVRNLTCPTRPGAAQLCATGARPRLRATGTLAWRQCLVIAQIDLPIPR